MPVVGPHVGALLGAMLYQLIVGLHWPDSYDVTPEAPNQKTVDGELNHAIGNLKKEKERERQKKREFLLLLLLVFCAPN